MFFYIMLFLLSLVKQVTFCSTEDSPEDIFFNNEIVDDNHRNISVHIYLRNSDKPLEIEKKVYKNVNWLTLGRKNKKLKKNEKNNVMLSYEEILYKLKTLVDKDSGAEIENINNSSNNVEINLDEYLWESYKVNEYGEIVNLDSMENPTIFKLFIKEDEDDIMCGTTELHFYFVKFKRKILFFNKKREYLNEETKIVNIKLNLNKSLFLNRFLNIDIYELITEYYPYADNIEELYYKLSEDETKSEYRIIDLCSKEEAEDNAKNGIYAVDIIQYDKIKEKTKYCNCKKKQKVRHKTEKRGCCSKRKYTNFEIIKLDVNKNS